MTRLDGTGELDRPKRPSSWAIREQRLLEGLRAGTASRRFDRTRCVALPDGTLPWSESTVRRAEQWNAKTKTWVWADVLGLDGKPAVMIHAIHRYAGPRARTINRGVTVGGDFYSPALAAAWRRILERGITGADVDLDSDREGEGRDVEVEGFTIAGWFGSVTYRGKQVARVSRLAPHLLTELLESVDRAELDAEVGYDPRAEERRAVEARIGEHVRAAVRDTFGVDRPGLTAFVLGGILGALRKDDELLARHGLLGGDEAQP